MESTSEAIVSAERFFVPLNTMCSMKWETPLCSGVSWRLPRLSQTPMVTLRTWGIDSVIRVRPFSKTCLAIILWARVGTVRVAHARLASVPMRDEDYSRYVRINLPHARTIGQRIARTLDALGAFGHEGNGGARALSEALADLDGALRPYETDPPAEEALQAADAAADKGRDLVAVIVESPCRSDRLGQHVRNFFECLGLNQEGADLALKCGERPDSPLR